MTACGCDKPHAFQPPCEPNIVDASQSVWDALDITGDDVGDYPITWSDAWWVLDLWPDCILTFYELKQLPVYYSFLSSSWMFWVFCVSWMSCCTKSVLMNKQSMGKTLFTQLAKLRDSSSWWFLNYVQRFSVQLRTFLFHSNCYADRLFFSSLCHEPYRCSFHQFRPLV